MPSDLPKTLFVGLGGSAVLYYRCLLPAHALGADYVGLVGEPPDAHYVTGLVGKESKVPDFTNYDVVVLQQPHGEGWLNVIRELRERGVVVLYECDDWLHSIQKQPDHDFADSFTAEDLPEFEACMREADGMIVSTPFLRSVYQDYNRTIWVCENGIDPNRYRYTRPERNTVNIGWAGATGHRDTVTPWLQATAVAMSKRKNTTFVSIGQPFAQGFVPHFGPSRALSVPWCAVEQYPAAMTMFDIALAPAGESGFYRAKSDLRWLEASALGIPVVAHPLVYRHVRDRKTGLLATKPRQVERALLRLIDDEELRTAIGGAAREEVLRERAFPQAAEAWRTALCEAAVQQDVTSAAAM